MSRTKNPQVGPLFEDWLKDEGIHEEVTTASIKRVLAWQLEEAMKAQNLSRSQMAKRMETSRPQLDRVLDPTNTGVTLETLAVNAEVILTHLSAGTPK